MNRLEQIEARLAAATPGPWEADAYPVRKRSLKTGRLLAYNPEDGTLGSVSVIPSDGVYGEMDGHDAELIANAPTDLAALVTFAKLIASELADTDEFDGLSVDAVERMGWYLKTLMEES